MGYNRLAGQSVGRIEALSDGVFAVAMTLLVLDLHVPTDASVTGEGELWAAFVGMAPRFAVYLMSFLTLGIFWVGQQTVLNHVARSDRHFAWLNLGFLFTVTLTPFSTGLMAAFIKYRVALLLYWANILLMGLMLLAAWAYTRRGALRKPELDPVVARAIERRIIVAQSLYAFGALLSVFGTHWSLGFIVLVQLNYVFAPKLGMLWRI